MDPQASCLDVAGLFGSLIVRRDDQAAWLLLARETRHLHSCEDLKAAAEAMISDAAGPILQSQVIETATFEDWPAKKHGDVAVMYLALTGAGFSEAVTLTLALQEDSVVIRDLVWGRA